MNGSALASLGTREMLAVVLLVEDRAVSALAQACAADPRAPMFHALRSAAWMGDAATWANALAPALAEFGPRIADPALRDATIAFGSRVAVLHDAVGEGDDLVRQALIDLLPALEHVHISVAPLLWLDRRPEIGQICADERLRQALDVDHAAWRLSAPPLPGADLSKIAPHEAFAVGVSLGVSVVRSASRYAGVESVLSTALNDLCNRALTDIDGWIDGAAPALLLAEAETREPAVRAVFARARQTVGPLHHAIRAGFGPDEIAGLLLEAGDASVRLDAAGSPLAWRESARGRAAWQAVLEAAVGRG